jgi:MarR family transcriptional regulator for hemolysin
MKLGETLFLANTPPPSRRPERKAEKPRSPDIEARLRDPKFRFTVQLVLAARRWRSVLDEQLRMIGTSAARMEALSTIDRQPWLSAQVEIANRMGIEKPTLTRMLDMLEAEHLVERLPDPWDRRAKLIKLTPKGEESLDEASVVASGLRELLLDEFTEEEIVKINRFTERLLARLDRGLERPAED